MDEEINATDNEDNNEINNSHEERTVVETLPQPHLKFWHLDKDGKLHYHDIERLTSRVERLEANDSRTRICKIKGDDLIPLLLHQDLLRRFFQGLETNGVVSVFESIWIPIYSIFWRSI